MYLFESLYVTVVRAQRALPEGRNGDRFYPFFYMYAILLPIADTVFSVLMGVIGIDSREVMVADEAFPAHYLAAFPASLLVAWLLFDRRRVEIEKKFEGRLFSIKTSAHQAMVTLGFVLLVLVLFFLRIAGDFVSLSAYIALALVGYPLSKKGGGG